MPRSPVVAAVLAAVLATALTACSSGNSKASSKSNGSANASASLLAATTATSQAFKGTNRTVAPASRPAVKGKHVVVISSGQASISSQIPSDAAVAAAKAIGWQVDLYDAKLNPSTYAPLVRQAIAAGADGIVLDAIDCQTVQQPLEEAKAKGIQVVPIYAFDCNDPHAGGAARGLFTGAINYGPKSGNIDKFTESYGADQANYIIHDSGNKAKVLVIQDPEFTVLYYTYQGFKNTIDRSGGSQVVDTLEVTTADLTSGRLVAKIQAELLRHPEATWIKSPYTYVTTLGIVPALGPKAGQVKVMGGEGYAPELDLLRQGKITAVNIISSDWVGWAAIDAMNSSFQRQQPPDSGIGWALADKGHNLPASGAFVPPVDFKAAFKRAWGVG